jgi:hypothetical protein
MSPTVLDVLNLARHEIGPKENPPDSNRTKYGTWYGWQGVLWCDIFQSWLFGQFPGGLDLVGGKHAYTPSHAEWFKKHGRWGRRPRVGALVFFDFPDQIHRVQHVGLVEAVLDGGSRIQTIEGNTHPGRAGHQHDGDGVYRRIRATHNQVVGYGYPAYATAPARPPAPAPAPTGAPPFPLPDGHWFGPRLPLEEVRSVSGYYSHREDLRRWQERMRARGWRQLRATGRYDDSNTEKVTRAFQREKGLTVDGGVGPDTWAAAWTAPVT